MYVRQPTNGEKEAIFMMGFDAWGEGVSTSAYLNQCRTSEKYQAGTWFVLDVAQEPVASLITYRSSFNFLDSCYGIGSVATQSDHRKKGYASYLICQVVNIMEQRGARGIYLFADIERKFYEKNGFSLVTAQQPNGDSPCMVCAFRDVDLLMNAIPDYF